MTQSRRAVTCNMPVDCSHGT